MKKTVLEILSGGDHVATSERPPLTGVVVGRLVDLGDHGEPLVDFEDNPRDVPLRAEATSAIGPADIGGEVALLFADGDAERPILIGPLVRPQTAAPAAPEPSPLQATVDGERLEFTAGKEIVLRCGRASITLTRAGKILIRGCYILSRSAGVNRIKGGSIQLN
jgi:hypothetical protein